MKATYRQISIVAGCIAWLVAAPLHGGETQVKLRGNLQVNDNDQAIIAAFINHAVEFAGKVDKDKVKQKCLKAPEMFAWVDFRYLNCLNIAYELTGDTKYLDLFRDSFQVYREIMTTGTDSYLGWYGSPIKPRIPKDNSDIQIDELQMNFRAISILSLWVELARRNPEYAKRNVATINAYLKLMEKHLYPKWDRRGFFSNIEGRGGVYHGLDFPIAGGVTLSHEKHSIMVDALLKLYRVTGNPVYMKRALEIGRWFKSCLSLKDGHYEWMSWVPAGKWDIATNKADAWKVGWIAPDPNAAWYIAASSIAMNLYQYDLLYNDQDLARFVKTQKEMCWNGDMAKPEYRTVAGTKSKWVKGRFLSCQLALYDPTLTKLAFFGPHEQGQLASAKSSWKGGCNAQDYIREKFIMRPVVAKSPQPYQDFGKKFLADDSNQTFYQGLVYEVEEPGCKVPLKPSESVISNQ